MTRRSLSLLVRGRWAEVMVLQASPLLGAAFALGGLPPAALPRVAALLAGSVLLTAHVFVFNDWSGWRTDARDLHRAAAVSRRQGGGRRELALLSLGLLAGALGVLASLGAAPLLLGAAIAALGVAYSRPHSGAKGLPVAGSFLHFAGGSLHFLLGFAAVRGLDVPALGLSAFCGLVFAAGHLNQEVRDRDADLANGIRTNAVAFGGRATLVASFLVFTAAFADLVVLARLGVVPAPLAWTGLLWPVQLALTLRALRVDPGFDEARWLQRRYRLLFALIGCAMALALALPARGSHAGVRPATSAEDGRGPAVAVAVRRSL